MKNQQDEVGLFRDPGLLELDDQTCEVTASYVHVGSLILGPDEANKLHEWLGMALPSRGPDPVLTHS